MGADIHLVKRIPIGGGLGGGSSDAATVLVALNRLWGLNWSVDRLATLGLALGADVPFFLRGRKVHMAERLCLPARHPEAAEPAAAIKKKQRTLRRP